MANENMIKFLRGNVADLPQTATAGALYFTKDEGVYLGLENGSYHRYGDFITVADVKSLPATGAHETCMYYCTSENILARYDSVKGWIQINKQPTAEEMKTLLGLGSAAYTDASAYDAAGSAKAVSDYVGEIPSTATATNIVAYIQEKTAGIATDTALEELTGRVADTEKDIEDIQDALDGKSDDGHKHVKADITDFDHTHVVADITDFDDKVKAYDYATKTEAQGYADAKDDAIAEAKQAGTDATNALNTYKGEMVTALAGKQDVIPENTYDAYGSAAQALADAQADATTKAGQALTDAKAYVDAEDVFHTDITTVNALGGIAAGADLDGMTTHEILNTLLFPYVAFVINSSSRNAAAATLENGATQTLNSASISVTKKSKPITSIKLFNGSTVLEEKTGDEVAAGGTITFSNLGITVSKDNNPNLKFTVTDGTTSTDKNVGASTFVYPYYTGECAADATIDETLIEGLTKSVASKGNKTVTHSCENGRMVIAYPKAHGVLKSILDPNNFETIGDYTRSEVSVTGLDGTTQTYYVYASGAATVNGFKVQYKY